MKGNDDEKPPWQVDFTGSAKKQKGKLPRNIAENLFLLKFELEQEGPVQPEWRNYGQIVNAAGFHHCHLNNQHPRYVAVWKVVDPEEQVIEIRFVGPHGSVNYSRFK